MLLEFQIVIQTSLRVFLYQAWIVCQYKQDLAKLILFQENGFIQEAHQQTNQVFSFIKQQLLIQDADLVGILLVHNE